MREDPFDLLEQVVDRASFLRFLAALGDDFAEGDRASKDDPYRYGMNDSATGWCNGRIDSFIEAAVAGSQGKTPTASNIWRECAEILFTGKVYE